jgi:hypothetical protein
MTFLKTAVTHNNNRMIIFWFNKLKTVENFEKQISTGECASLLSHPAVITYRSLLEKILMGFFGSFQQKDSL